MSTSSENCTGAIPIPQGRLRQTTAEAIQRHMTSMHPAET